MENQNDVNNAALEFAFSPTEENHSIIKVVGVGGGGSNAVENMYRTGIQDVSFLIINTDKQALKGSAIPNKLLISDKGLGAGANPEIAREFALQYTDAISQALSDGTEMVFITAGMGGGTGTGAAPIVAQIAQSLGILTIGIVTIPFRFEGKKKIVMALDGVRAIEKWCDALLVVNNNKLVEIYPDLNFGNAFLKADETLTNAAKSISDIINKQGYINLDFADVSTTLRHGGVALISTGSACGENRLSKAIEDARHSPLLQDNKIDDAKHLLFELCFSHSNPLTMAEINEMNEFVETLNSDIEVIWGAMYDDSLGDDVRIILLASGFQMNHDTGDVIAGSIMESHLKRIQSSLREAIVRYKNYIADFSEYPAAEEILLSAIREATDISNKPDLDTDVEAETAKLEIAHSKAKDLVAEAKHAEEGEKIKEAERLRIAAIEAQIAKLQSQLPTPAPKPSDEAAEPATAENKPAAETNPVTAETKPVENVSTPKVSVELGLFDDELPEPESATPASEVSSATVVSSVVTTNIPPVSTEVEPAQSIKPASDPISAIDEIRRYYGDEAANRMILDDVRKAYYVLDEQDLTNDQLIAQLEHLPAYNRKLSDLNQLKAISKKPAQPKPLGRHDESLF